MRRRGWLLLGGVFALPFAAVGVLALIVVAIASPGTANTAALADGTVPQAYVTLIDQAGGTCPILSPPLLAAQLYQESGFDPNAVSPAGAVGIAQFMPATWPHWTSNGDGDGQSNPRNPADAIPAAARYDCALAAQLKNVPGDPVNNMLAAYNAGAGAVLAAAGVPSIQETQQYVKNIRALEVAFAAPTGPVAPSELAVRAIAFAYDRLGTPYEWGGNGTDGRFDCSGLTEAAYASVGIAIPRVAADQWYAGPHVPRDQLQPGDLVFYATDLKDPASIHHVGIYVGGGAMIDAPHTGATIRFDPVDAPDYFGATRPGPTVPSWPVGPSATPTPTATG